MSNLTIGFIGLGNMGGPMAANLAAAGHTVRGNDVAGTTAEGVTEAKTIAEAVADADVVITMLPNGAILRQVAEEAVAHMAPGALLIDCS
ncbi:NAD(P)-binding domain-containing protein, partial [Sulfitobacter sp. M22298]